MSEMQRRSDNEPNIVFIFTDDLRCYENTDYETSSIDQLAKDVMKFTVGYC